MKHSGYSDWSSSAEIEKVTEVSLNCSLTPTSEVKTLLSKRENISEQIAKLKESISALKKRENLTIPPLIPRLNGSTPEELAEDQRILEFGREQAQLPSEVQADEDQLKQKEDTLQSLEQEIESSGYMNATTHD